MQRRGGCWVSGQVEDENNGIFKQKVLLVSGEWKTKVENIKEEKGGLENRNESGDTSNGQHTNSRSQKGHFIEEQPDFEVRKTKLLFLHPYPKDGYFPGCSIFHLSDVSLLPSLIL